MKLVYAIMVSVPVEKHNIHMHTSPVIPQVAPTHLTLRGQRCIRDKNVFTSCRSSHKIFSGLYSLWVRDRDSSYDGLQPLPHNRDCPQASLVLRGRVWDSHHPARGYLPSTTKSKLQKVNTKSKSLLACHQSRLL
jgi:hypothetical protein